MTRRSPVREVSLSGSSPSSLPRSGARPRGRRPIRHEQLPDHGAFVPGQANGIGFEDLVAIEDHAFLQSLVTGVPFSPSFGDTVEVVAVQSSWTGSAASARVVTLDAARFDALEHHPVAVVGDAQESITALGSLLDGWAVDPGWAGRAGRAQVELDAFVTARTAPDGVWPPSWGETVIPQNVTTARESAIRRAARALVRPGVRPSHDPDDQRRGGTARVRRRCGRRAGGGALFIALSTDDEPARPRCPDATVDLEPHGRVVRGTAGGENQS